MKFAKYFVSVTQKLSCKIEIDEIDAQHCDGKLKEHFPQFLTKAVFPSNPSIVLSPLSPIVELKGNPTMIFSKFK